MVGAGQVDLVIPLIVDKAGEFQSVYGDTGGTGYLVQPDGYVGFRAAPHDLRRLRSHLKACSPPSPSPG
jgi:hypothetical protein